MTAKHGPKMGALNFRVIRSNLKESFPKLTQEEKDYFSCLHRLVDEIYKEAASKKRNMTWNQLAVEAGLSYVTVANLGDGLTKFPRFATVWKLAKAVGWELSLSRKSTVVVKKKAG